MNEIEQQRREQIEARLWRMLDKYPEGFEGTTLTGDSDPQSARPTNRPASAGHGNPPWRGPRAAPETAAPDWGIELESHSVMGSPFNHALIRITPRNQDAYKNDPRFQNIDKQGRRYATLGAGPDWSGRLKSGYNRERDVPPHPRGVMIALPQGISEDEFINRLFKKDREYDDLMPYEAFPDPQLTSRFGNQIPASYNSNSYVSGLLRAAGVMSPDAPAWLPGYLQPAPARNYGP